MNFVFSQYFDIAFQLTENLEIDKDPEHFYINYSTVPKVGFYHIFQHSLLLEETIYQQNITISKEENLPVFFQTTEDAFDLKFDIFSCIFYLISRYEEYLPHDKDIHGRYLSKNSILSNESFNFAPIVEYWLQDFKNKLYKQKNTLIFKPHTFQYIPTFDIDNAYQILGRNWLNKPPNIFKSSTIKTLIHIQQDSYDIFEKLFNEIQQYKFQPIFFCLLSDTDKRDSNVSPKSKQLKQLIKKIVQKHTVGIHSSYHSLSQNIIAEELHYLESIINKEVFIVRQHFLKISFPNYFRKLIDVGIEKDYSLIYPDVSGFRAGCSKAFYFFDVEQNQETNLLLQPSCIMDATFEYYQRVESSIINLNFSHIFSQLKEINGTLVPIFHNDLLAKEMYWNFYTLINKIIATENENKDK